MFGHFFIGFILSLIYVNLIFCGKCGTVPRFAPNIPGIVSNGHIIIKNYHIHHWLICFILLLIILILSFLNGSNSSYMLFFGGCIVFIYQGLGYDDCFNFTT